MPISEAILPVLDPFDVVGGEGQFERLGIADHRFDELDLLERRCRRDSPLRSFAGHVTDQNWAPTLPFFSRSMSV